MKNSLRGLGLATLPYLSYPLRGSTCGGVDPRQGTLSICRACLGNACPREAAKPLPAGTGLARLLFHPLTYHPTRHGQAGRWLTGTLCKRYAILGAVILPTRQR